MTHHLWSEGTKGTWMSWFGCLNYLVKPFEWRLILFGEMIQIFFANKLKFGTSFVASPCGSFGLNAMTKSSIINNSTSQMSNTAFGMNLSCMLRQRGNG